MIQNPLENKLTKVLGWNHLLPEYNSNEWVRIVNKVVQQVETTDLSKVLSLELVGRTITAQ